MLNDFPIKTQPHRRYFSSNIDKSIMYTCRHISKYSFIELIVITVTISVDAPFAVCEFCFLEAQNIQSHNYVISLYQSIYSFIIDESLFTFSDRIF